jgi:hypothetical protein
VGLEAATVVGALAPRRSRSGRQVCAGVGSVLCWLAAAPALMQVPPHLSRNPVLSLLLQRVVRSHVTMLSVKTRKSRVLCHFAVSIAMIVMQGGSTRST